jgi:hypothetical protein
MGDLECQVRDKVRLRDGLESLQGVLAGEVGEVT